MKRFFVLFLSLLLLDGQAQIANDPVFILPDTARPFSLENFYEQVISYHPVGKQADLLSDVAKQEIRLARGQFDPKLEAEYLLKQYEGSEYYNLFDGSLKLPTRSPLTPSVGVERNKGDYVNPENYISSQYDYRQVYAALSLPLGQGLMTDERRTALKQAELFRQLMEAEQVNIINKLLLDAAKDYWNWFYSYYNYRLASTTAEIASDLFRRTLLNFEGGELAPVDTVQAKITLLERLVAKQEALAQLNNSAIIVSSYMWDSLQNPLQLSARHAPIAGDDFDILSTGMLNELMNLAKTNHPELLKLKFKLQQLELDQRLASEFLKPKLNVSYYLLNQPIYPEGVITDLTFDNNFKLGVDFAFPLFLRKERAKVAQTKLKLSATRYDQQLAFRKITNDINVAFNQLVTDGLVLQQQRQMVDNYSRLMNAEMLNLDNGESDLFKINIQQEKLYNAQSKFIKVMADYQKQKAILYWSAGVRPLK